MKGLLDVSASVEWAKVMGCVTSMKCYQASQASGRIKAPALERQWQKKRLAVNRVSYQSFFKQRTHTIPAISPLCNRCSNWPPADPFI
jgi:hypothetical protein